MASLNYLIWLTTRPYLSPELAVRLLEHFGSAEATYFADQGEYDLLKLPAGLKEGLRDKSLTGTEHILGECDRLGLWIMTCQDASYPERLRQIGDYPLVLYGKGRQFRFDEELAIGMVGARRATAYGISMAGRLGLELARGGALVVSGIAEGIDTAALRGALKGGGHVVSVLGGGIDVIYPPQNAWLYADVAAAGTLLSEYPPGTETKGWHFPVRNRIISGLSVGVTVVEAGMRSGALITAHRALDQSRDVFAVPGAADAPMSVGTNDLIARGEAKLVRAARDILVEYETRFPHRLRYPARLSGEETEQRLVGAPLPVEEKQRAPAVEVRKEAGAGQAELPPLRPRAELEGMGDEQREILLLLSERTLGPDEIVDRTEIPARRVNTALTLLQAGGYLEELPGRRFRAAVRFPEE